MGNIWWLIPLLFLLWYWWDSRRSGEIARQTGFNACQRADVQFLDDSVERKRIWLRRNQKGQLEICRLYFFEFSSDGGQRYQGRIVMTGKLVSEVTMDAYRIPSV